MKHLLIDENLPISLAGLLPVECSHATDLGTQASDHLLWMHARESLLKSEVFGDDLKKVLPIIEPGMSDSASFDNVMEFLHMQINGY